MYFKKLLPASIAGAALLASASAFADINIGIGSASGAVAGTVTVTYSYSALDADDVGGFQFDITYDPAALTPSNIANCGNNAPATHVASCTEPGGAGNGTIRVLIADFVPPTQEISPFNIDPFGEVEFTINQAGTHTLTFTNPVGSDLVGGNVPMSGTNGAVTGAITGAAGYASVPAPGTTINLGAALVGQTINIAPADITVSETGDQTLNVTDTSTGITGGNAGDFASLTAPFMIVDGGASVDVDLTCTPSARGTRTSQINLANNSVNAPTPVYPLTCAGLSPNVGVSPANITLNGLVSDPADPTGTITVTNPQDGFTATADVSSAAVGDAAITVSPAGPVSVVADGSTGFTVSCARGMAGNFTSTVTISWTDTNGNNGGMTDVAVDCTILDAVPSFAGTPAPPGPLAFGVVTNGVTSPPLGIDVANDGVGPTPTSDLTITSAVTSDPQFTATVNNSGPFLVGNPAVADAVEVTCTPDMGTVGAFAGTLTINHNGDDSPSVYNLTCSGQSDAVFGSTPADGGTLNLGVVPPATTTPAGDITFENTGLVDELTVACSVTDPDGVFTWMPDPIDFTIAAGNTAAASFQCTPPAPGVYSADVACTIGNATNATTASYTVTCMGQPLVVPTMNRWGLLLMALALLALGGFAGRRMMA